MKHTKNTLKLKTEKVKYLCVYSEHTTFHRLYRQGRQSERLKNCSPKILCPPCYCRSSALTRATPNSFMLMCMNLCLKLKNFSIFSRVVRTDTLQRTPRTQSTSTSTTILVWRFKTPSHFPPAQLDFTTLFDAFDCFMLRWLCSFFCVNCRNGGGEAGGSSFECILPLGAQRVRNVYQTSSMASTGFTCSAQMVENHNLFFIDLNFRENRCNKLFII